MGKGFNRKIFYYYFPVVSNQAKLIGDANEHFVSAKRFGYVVDFIQLKAFGNIRIESEFPVGEEAKVILKAIDDKDSPEKSWILSANKKFIFWESQ